MTRSRIKASSLNVHFIFLFAVSCIFCSCEKEEPVKPLPLTDTVTDIENHSYKTVKIGQKWWMAENLAVTKFRNGTAINQFQNTSDWNSGSPAYCVYDNNSTAPGLLYNWAAVNSADLIAPAGWHVATEEDWKALEKELGMTDSTIEKLNWRENGNCGDKLKIAGTQGWSGYSGVWGSNESGFTALAGSCRLFNGIWGNPGLFATGFWWTASENDGSTAWYRHLDYKKSGVFRFYGPKNYGFSVRCVKD